MTTEEQKQWAADLSVVLKAQKNNVEKNKAVATKAIEQTQILIDVLLGKKPTDPLSPLTADDVYTIIEQLNKDALPSCATIFATLLSKQQLLTVTANLIEHYAIHFNKTETDKSTFLRGQEAVTVFMTTVAVQTSQSFFKKIEKAVIVPIKNLIAKETIWSENFNKELFNLLEKFIQTLTSPNNLEKIPAEIRWLCHSFEQTIQKHLYGNPDEKKEKYRLVGGFLFLRWLSPFFATYIKPKEGTTPTDQECLASTLKAISKSLQALANCSQLRDGNPVSPDWQTKINENFLCDQNFELLLSTYENLCSSAPELKKPYRNLNGKMTANYRLNIISVGNSATTVNNVELTKFLPSSIPSANLNDDDIFLCELIHEQDIDLIQRFLYEHPGYLTPPWLLFQAYLIRQRHQPISLSSVFSQGKPLTSVNLLTNLLSAIQSFQNNGTTTEIAAVALQFSPQHLAALKTEIAQTLSWTHYTTAEQITSLLLLTLIRTNELAKCRSLYGIAAQNEKDEKREIMFDAFFQKTISCCCLLNEALTSPMVPVDTGLGAIINADGSQITVYKHLEAFRNACEAQFKFVIALLQTYDPTFNCEDLLNTDQTDLINPCLLTAPQLNKLYDHFSTYVMINTITPLTVRSLSEKTKSSSTFFSSINSSRSTTSTLKPLPPLKTPMNSDVINSSENLKNTSEVKILELPLLKMLDYSEDEINDNYGQKVLNDFLNYYNSGNHENNSAAKINPPNYNLG